MPTYRWRPNRISKNQGTEFVHRVLFDAGISHEYRLLKGADHVGASLVPRSLDAFAFIGRQLNPPKWIDDTALRFRVSLITLCEGEGRAI